MDRQAMNSRTRTCSIVALLCLLAAPVVMAGDAASSLPAHWAERLVSVQEVTLNDMDAEARDSVIVARKQLNALLQDAATATDRLADAYGELGGLYQVYLVFPAAEACYRNAIQLAPGQFRWLYYAAYLADDSGISERAAARYEAARQLRPEYKALTVRLGNVRLDLNQLDAAQAEFEQVDDADGLEAASLYGLGQLALLKRDFEAAVDYFKRALAIEPEATRIHYPLARALRAIKRNEEAKTHLALRGDQLPTIMDPQIESLEALKIGTRIHFLHAMKAAKKQDYAAAAEAFARGLVREPDNVAARISYARSLYLSGDKNGARRELEAALARQADNALGLFLLGVLSEEEGDPESAIRYYQLAVQHVPDHAGANDLLANQYFRRGEYAMAASHYAGSIRGEPGNQLVYMPYLGALLKSGATDDQIMSALNTGTSTFPEHPGLQSLHIVLLVSSSNPQARNPEEAHELAQQLAGQRLLPQHQELLALTHAATGDFEKAVEIQEQHVSYAVWYMPTEAERLTRVLSAYQAGKLPPREDLISWSLFQPAAFIGAGPFSHYPTPKPY
jgi:tetratricopeptide (TPR) repeat protein